jgi:hypothetical protein
MKLKHHHFTLRRHAFHFWLRPQAALGYPCNPWTTNHPLPLQLGVIDVDEQDQP